MNEWINQSTEYFLNGISTVKDLKKILFLGNKNIIFRQISVCSLLYLIRQSVWALIFLKQSDDKADSQDWIKNKEDILLTNSDKYSDVSKNEIFQFGISRFKLYQKLKYNIMALEIWIKLNKKYIFNESLIFCTFWIDLLIYQK